MDTFIPQHGSQTKKPMARPSFARRWATAGTSGLLVAVAGYATLTSGAETARVSVIADAVAPVARDVQGALVSPTEMTLVTDSSTFDTFSISNTPATQPTTQPVALLAGGMGETVTGNSGAAEPIAAAGATGATGATEIAGATGATGSTGATEVAGATGATGSTGATEVAGAAGATGSAGNAGSAAFPKAWSEDAFFGDDTGVHNEQTAGVTWTPTTKPAEQFISVSSNAVTPNEGPSDANPSAPPTHDYPPSHEKPSAMTPPPAHDAPPASNAKPVTAAAPTVAPTAAAPTKGNGMVTSGLDANGRIMLTLNRTAEVKTNVPVKRVSIGQPEIADVQPFNSNMILVTAKKPGTTQVIVWDDKDRSQSIDVSVEIPLDQLKDLIAKVAPGATVDVSVANDQIVLRGQAPNLTVAKQVSDLAGAYGKVQNFIEVAGAQTVAVQVQFAEVSRSVTNDLGVSWAYQNGTSIFGNDAAGSGLLGYHTSGEDDVIDSFSSAKNPGAFNIFGIGSVNGNPFSYFIKALRQNSLLRILQEPTLTTTSGEAASFLAGGQVPVPVPADNGQIAIEYKEFGVRLKLTPVVLGNGKIRLVMEAESSELDYANGTTISGAAVPGLRTRRVQNTVELGEGQTISVAGLLDDSVTASKRSVPLLGDIPVLGQLFRSTRYQRRETELVVLITPRLAGAMNPDQVTPLPGSAWRHPNELEQFAFGDMGGNQEADAVKDWNKPASQRGLKPGETQTNTTRAQEPAALTRGDTQQGPPPTFVGEHGFAPPEPDAMTNARD